MPKALAVFEALFRTRLLAVNPGATEVTARLVPEAGCKSYVAIAADANVAENRHAATTEHINNLFIVYSL